MEEDRKIDQRFAQPVYLLVKAFEMNEVPLLLFRNQNSFSFLEQASVIIRGQVIYASSDDAIDQLLALLVSAGYIFFVIDGELSDQVYDVVSYYLHMRDPAAEWKPELERRYQDFPIDSENRLALVSELDTLKAQRPERQRYLQQLSTMIVVQ